MSTLSSVILGVFSGKHLVNNLMSLKQDEHIKCFVGKMFQVWDENHRLQVWNSVINKIHSIELDWHMYVDSILLTPFADIVVLFIAMNDLNR